MTIKTARSRIIPAPSLGGRLRYAVAAGICTLVALPAVGATESGEALDLPTTTIEGNLSTLTVPDTAQATANIQRTPGAVEIVPDTVFKTGPAQTIKDVLGWVPGVFAQSRFGDDARVSIRGSGLSRNYGNRGINMYMDGIPINTSDGHRLTAY